MSVQQDFDKAYRASLPPELAEFPITETAAQELIGNPKLDVPIMVWGWDPYTTMAYRLSLGIKYTPPAWALGLGAIDGYALPNVPALPTQQAYPTTKPTGWLTVSTNPADFPPYQPSATAPPVSNVDPVGALNFGNVYFPVAGFTYINGQTYTDARGTFTAVVTAGPFGNYTYLVLGTATS